MWESCCHTHSSCLYLYSANVYQPTSDVIIYIWLTVPTHHKRQRLPERSFTFLSCPFICLFCNSIYVVKVLFAIAFVFNITLEIYMLSNSRPWKRVQCSSDPEKVFLIVPQFCSHNLNNILNIKSRNVSKRANKEQLKCEEWFAF